MVILLIILQLFLLLFAAVILIPVFPTIFGRGVPFVRTPMRIVRLMIGVAGIKDGNVIYDLGCGDGRLVIEAAKRHNISATGVEKFFFVYLLAKARKFIFKSKVQILREDMFKVNLSKANVVFCYLFPRVMNELKEKFEKELPLGARIVSHAFKIEGWKPVCEIKRDRAKKIPPILVYEMGKSNV